jgi:hypothetical protein
MASKKTTNSFISINELAYLVFLCEFQRNDWLLWIRFDKPSHLVSYLNDQWEIFNNVF